MAGRYLGLGQKSPTSKRVLQVQVQASRRRNLVKTVVQVEFIITRISAIISIIMFLPISGGNRFPVCAFPHSVQVNVNKCSESAGV